MRTTDGAQAGSSQTEGDWEFEIRAGRRGVSRTPRALLQFVDRFIY